VVGGIAGRDFFLSLIGLMVGFGAWQERQIAAHQAAPKWEPVAPVDATRVVLVPRATVRSAMTAPPPTVGLSQRIRELGDLAPAASVAGALPVMDRDGYVIGVLPAARLAAALRDQPDAPVLELMRRIFPIARPDEQLYEQWYKTSAEDQHYVVVLEENGRLAGWLTRADISNGLRVGQSTPAAHDSAWQELDREFV
jgi:predicted transcriptional regulator